MAEPISLVILAIVAALAMFTPQGSILRILLPFIGMTVESKESKHRHVSATYKGRALFVDTPHGEIIFGIRDEIYYRLPGAKPGELYEKPVKEVVPWSIVHSQRTKYPFLSDVPLDEMKDWKRSDGKAGVLGYVNRNKSHFDEYAERLEEAAKEKNLARVHITKNMSIETVYKRMLKEGAMPGSYLPVDRKRIRRQTT